MLNFYFLSSFWLGEGGEMGHAPERPKVPCVELQYGLPVDLLARWINLPPDLPTKPSYAGEPGHIPLKEI